VKIGELAKATSCSIQTIRYYEKEQLLPSPERSEGNYRIYSTATVTQLLFIKQCRSLDLSLAEIKQLLNLSRSPSSQCSDINQMIDVHIQQVEERIQELRLLQQQLRNLGESCSSDRTIEQCGILHLLSANPSLAS
jgi:Cd(II)/Pb(II)-responsive transcriptional regulator